MCVLVTGPEQPFQSAATNTKCERFRQMSCDCSAMSQSTPIQWEALLKPRPKPNGFASTSLSSTVHCFRRDGPWRAVLAASTVQLRHLSLSRKYSCFDEQSCQLNTALHLLLFPVSGILKQFTDGTASRFSPVIFFAVFQLTRQPPATIFVTGGHVPLKPLSWQNATAGGRRSDGPQCIVPPQCTVF